MKKLFFFIFLLLQCILAVCQKPVLDYSACLNFPSIGISKISNDGKFVLYTIDKKSIGTCLIIKSVDSSYTKQIMGVPEFGKADFIKEGKGAVFLTKQDSLGILDFSTRTEIYIPNCRSYKTIGKSSQEWLAYQLKNYNLILVNLETGEKKEYGKMADYLFNAGGYSLLVKKEIIVDSVKQNSLQLIDLRNGKLIKVWQGLKATNYNFDITGSKLAFFANEENSANAENAIWYFDTTMSSAKIVVNSKDSVFKNIYTLRPSALKFNTDGKKLFFNIYQRINSVKQNPNLAKITVWSFQDDLLQTEQADALKNSKNRMFAAVVVLDKNNQKVIQLEQENDEILYGSKINEGSNGNFFLTTVKVSKRSNQGSMERSAFLVNTSNGTKTLVVKGLILDIRFSPGGKFLVWYDRIAKAFFTYNIAAKKIVNITSFVNFPIYNERYDGVGFPSPYSIQPAVWLKSDKGILIYDRYDIWKLDPTGIEKPINITNGFGRKNKIILRYVNKEGNIINNPPIAELAVLTLCAFDEKNKTNGFFRKDITIKGDPVKLIMAKELFYFPSEFAFVDLSNWLIKADHSEVYLLNRMSPTEFPNLQVTKDFITFKQVSDLAPQKAYNWLTAELVEWQSLNGKTGQGILYKPENFDPKKKYPIIFHLYEKQSNGIYKFLPPDLCDGPINIPLFVSQGYLVFCPDIFYKIGNVGQSVYDFVVPAVKMMCAKPWVNNKKIGIEGHSFGGYEVNYLITKTKLFAAAAEAAGVSNIISSYGALQGNTKDSHESVERGQNRLGYTLWQNKSAYINDSPLFFADRVSTPLLIMHNKEDGSVPWMQGIEFFTALRHLKKAAWLLEYDNEGHVLLDDKNKLDYSVRLMQFFGHYLKNDPPAKWLVDGVPFKVKGLDDGLKID